MSGRIGKMKKKNTKRIPAKDAEKVKIQKEERLGQEPIGKLLWSMTVPSIIGVMAYNLYNIFDTLFISIGVGTDAVGGVSVSLPLFIFLSAVSSTLGSGGASVMSRALGQKDYEKAGKTVGNTFSLFYITAILVTVTGLLYLDEMLHIMGITESLLPYARAYSRIILAGAISSTGFSSLIRAEGSSRYAMYIWVIPMGANILLDIVFIFALHWGVTGAALATVLSQVISMGMSIYYFFFSGKRALRLLPRHFLPDKKVLKEIISIGIPSFVQMSGLSISVIMTNRFLGIYGGALSISAYGIVSKIYTFFLIPILGLTQGLQPVIGYNNGAKKMERVRAALKLSSLTAAGYGLMMLLLTVLSAEAMVHIFTKDAEVITLGSHALRIISAGLLFSGLQYVQATYYQATGKKGRALCIALCNYVICYFPSLYILTSFYGLEGVWYALPLSAAVTAAVSLTIQAHGKIPGSRGPQDIR